MMLANAEPTKNKNIPGQNALLAPFLRGAAPSERGWNPINTTDVSTIERSWVQIVWSQLRHHKSAIISYESHDIFHLFLGSIIMFLLQKLASIDYPHRMANHSFGNSFKSHWWLVDPIISTWNDPIIDSHFFWLSTIFVMFHINVHIHIFCCFMLIRSPFFEAKSWRFRRVDRCLAEAHPRELFSSSTWLRWNHGKMVM